MSNVYPIDRAGNYRQPAPDEPQGQDLVVTMDGEGGDVPQFDPATGTTQIETDDGGIIIAFGPPKPQQKESNFDDNLAEYLDEHQLATVAEKLLMGIDTDEQSRAAWLTNASEGISLLGLELKNVAGAATAQATPAEGVSVIDSPLLLEAVLRFQANARGELLPVDGPVKVKQDGENKGGIADTLATALEKDLNHYLTKTAKEYYPDTDRMLLLLGFSGISFKKGFHDPIKRRPVIASIDAKDLIVSNNATDIDGAGRVTHRILMKPSTLRRMQLVGAYRDVVLPAMQTLQNPNPVDAKINIVQGIAPMTPVEPMDQDRELFETYTEIELPGFEHTLEGQETGLPLPYKIVLDKDSRKILAIHRNWHEDDPFCMPRNRIIAYIFIPGLGFYGIGLLNVLGNATKAMTAAWRLMLDAGMFANFPGFLYAKSLAKQLTNQFRIPPGGGMAIDTVGNDIRASVMPLPYKDPSAVFIQLIDNIAATAQRVGGTAELQIGEGKQDAPVGTTLALIEQATKLMSAVHKRLHQAQGQEFDMLKSLLMEDPAALWRHNKKSEVLKWMIEQAGQKPIADQMAIWEEQHKAKFLLALNDCELIPRADPNTASQTERYLKIMALRQMADTNTSIDKNKVDERAMRILGVDDPEALFVPPMPGQPGPDDKIADATMLTAQARMLDSQTKAGELQLKSKGLDLKNAADMQGVAGRERIAAMGIARELVVHQKNQKMERDKMMMDAHQRAADRIANHVSGIADRHHQFAMAQLGHQATGRQKMFDRTHQGIMELNKHGRAAAQDQADKIHELKTSAIDRAHEANQNALDRQHQVSMNKGVEGKKEK